MSLETADVFNEDEKSAHTPYDKVGDENCSPDIQWKHAGIQVIRLFFDNTVENTQWKNQA